MRGPGPAAPRTIGAQQAGHARPRGTAGSQFIFFFTDAASAQQTFTWLQSQYTSACLVGGNSNVQVTKTGGDGVSSAAWLSVKKTSAGPVDMSPYNREYFVLRGSTIPTSPSRAPPRSRRRTTTPRSSPSSLPTSASTAGPATDRKRQCEEPGRSDGDRFGRALRCQESAMLLSSAAARAITARSSGLRARSRSSSQALRCARAALASSWPSAVALKSTLRRSPGSLVRTA